MKSIVKYIVFVLYILVLLRLTVMREATMEEAKVNLSLFEDLIKIYKNGSVGLFLWLFLGNLVWFVPFGFMISSMVRKCNFFLIMISGFAFSFLIEVMQYVLKKGVFEIDDLILNTTGALIGYGIYKIVNYKSHAKA